MKVRLLFLHVAVLCTSLIASHAQSNQCVPHFGIDSLLTKADGLYITKASAAYLNHLKKNKEPSLKYFDKPLSYKPSSKKIFDNKRMYSPKHMMRTPTSRLIKMYRGLDIEKDNTFAPESAKDGSPIWITSSYELAMKYAAEWTHVDKKSSTPVILEMLIPEFLIYWKDNPREEAMPEAFILSKDINTLDSFITKIHKPKRPTPKKSVLVLPPW